MPCDFVAANYEIPEVYIGFRSFFRVHVISYEVYVDFLLYLSSVHIAHDISSPAEFSQTSVFVGDATIRELLAFREALYSYQ